MGSSPVPPDNVELHGEVIQPQREGGVLTECQWGAPSFNGGHCGSTGRKPSGRSKISQVKSRRVCEVNLQRKKARKEEEEKKKKGSMAPTSTHGALPPLDANPLKAVF